MSYTNEEKEMLRSIMEDSSEMLSSMQETSSTVERMRGDLAEMIALYDSVFNPRSNTDCRVTQKAAEEIKGNLDKTPKNKKKKKQTKTK